MRDGVTPQQWATHVVSMFELLAVVAGSVVDHDRCVRAARSTLVAQRDVARREQAWRLSGFLRAAAEHLGGATC